MSREGDEQKFLNILFLLFLPLENQSSSIFYYKTTLYPLADYIFY